MARRALLSLRRPPGACACVDTRGGKEMDKFCAACHAMKADAAEVEKIQFFTSMDETGSRIAAPAAAAPAQPAAKPAAGKK